MKALSFASQGVQGGEIRLDDLAWPLSLAEKTLGDVLSDRHATFSWQELTQGSAPKAAQLRHFLEIDPVLNFSALQPGADATARIRQAVADLDLEARFGAAVDLTGQVPMNDDQFSVIQQSAVRDNPHRHDRRIDRPLARAPLIEDHRCGILQLDGRAFGHCRAGALHGRRVQPDFDRILRPLRRPRCRFRHSIQRALPFGTSQTLGFACGAAQRSPKGCGPALARCGGNRGRISFHLFPRAAGVCRNWA
jgi:hypothetical protein